MTGLFRRYGTVLALTMLATSLIWMVALIVLPNLMMVDLSFRPNLLPAEIGGPKDVHTLANYETLWRNSIHFGIFLKTIWGSTLVTALSLAVCYPIAYYLAQEAGPNRAPLFMMMLLIPYWVNELLRTFAWYIILGYTGPLNAVLQALGITSEPIRFISGDTGVMIGLVYAYILFMVLPLYSAIESLDRNQIEAARDLGASTWRIHWRIVVPHAKPGIVVGCIMTFMLAASSYAVPSILSGGSRWFTEIIYGWFFDGQNWNQGAAYAFILLILCIGFILGMMALFRVRLGDIAK
ncbi:ABC transporter permease [Zavarzinia sp. CC-PAN008]|uniref:ABC transporter permease n=1 Tax=Zavarzinia sp. CC-PAN008 TaxID=3243332 RepID=UPI003F742DD8